MTNKERIAARIARDKARKAERRAGFIEKHGRFENVITNQTLFRSLRRRVRNVQWKGSVQRYLSHCIVKNKRAKDNLLAGNDPDINKTVIRMHLYERGKLRRISAEVIDTRVIEGAICDSCITPLTQRTLIYDNPASTAGKGTTFVRNRTVHFVQDTVKELGEEAYVLLYDFSNFFASIPHWLCWERLRKTGMDERLQRLCMFFIAMHSRQEIESMEDTAKRGELLEKLENGEGIGLTLGSQESQNMALVTPNDLDHMIKDREKTKRYTRYMDDGCAYGTKAALKNLLVKIQMECARLGLKLNEKKTRIVKLQHGFSFLKIRYVVTKSGQILRRPARSGIVRMRRKVSKHRANVDAGKMTMDDAFNAISSWKGNLKKYTQSYHSRKAVVKKYNTLFCGYRMEGIPI